MERIKRLFTAVKFIFKHGDEVFKDSLTGCYVRVLFKDLVEREIDLTKRYKNKLCLVIIDMDGLKKINDEQGHLKEDKALKKIAEVLKANCRKTDLVFRWGGDEFIIIMPNTSKLAPNHFLKNVSKELDKFYLSISAGTSFWEKNLSLDALIDVADIKLLGEKKLKKAQI
jgi:diguanylate cyclase (GGDEF)-like protein